MKVRAKKGISIASRLIPLPGAIGLGFLRNTVPGLATDPSISEEIAISREAADRIESASCHSEGQVARAPDRA
ncbi:MAG: hypothetical protein RMK20_15335, partial [Verrucomicrobiales bacterium]|nr:hypothetical protein [Verrucomicrobiales bacterium]